LCRDDEPLSEDDPLLPLLLLLLLLLLLPDDDPLPLLLLLPEEEDELLPLLLPDSESESLTTCACAIIFFGAAAWCARRSSVRPPRPMEVKKLIANRVFFGISFGNKPPKAPCMYGSANFWFIASMPINSETSIINSLIKMRLDDVVSFSFKWIISRTCHVTASV